MNKKILSMFLVLCMMPTILPTTVLAVESHAHCVCGGHVSAGDHISHSEITYTALDSSFEGGSLPSGSYYLATDVTLTGSLTIASGETVNLCLNGHKLDANGGNFPVIQIQGTKSNTEVGTLNLCDCRQDDETAQEYWYYYESDLAKYMLSNSKPNGFDDMTVSKGSFHGGVITGSAAGNGGGVFNLGRFQMYSGTIAGNNVSVYGGGVYNYQYLYDNPVEMNLYGGRICGNKAGNNAGGGGMSVGAKSTITMYGGDIINNNANFGGGVNASISSTGKSASFIMQGGKISSNTARYRGGGVSVSAVNGSTVTFTMKGGEISGNTASENGGGVRQGYYSSVRLSDNIKITANKVGNLDSNIFLETGTFNITDALTNEEPIGVNMHTKGVFTSGTVDSSNYADKFKSDDGNYMVAVSGTQLELQLKPPATVSSVTVSPSSASVMKGETQRFDAIVTGEYEPEKTVTWTVNSTAGSTIDKNGLLTVAANETERDLTVKATSTVDASKSGEATVTVMEEPLTGTVNIDGPLKYGKQLTASVSGSNNTGALSYQWKRGSTEIGKGNTYIIKEVDIGDTISCEVSSTVESGSISASTDPIGKADSPVAPTVSFSFDGTNANKLMGTTEQMEYSVNGGDSYTACEANMNLTSQLQSITSANDIKVRVKETATHCEGFVNNIDIKKGGAVIGVSKADCTTAKNDGTLVGVTKAMEYKLSNASKWIAGHGSEIIKLPMGTYHVRNKATGTTLAGEESIYVIGIIYTLTINSNGSSGASGDGIYTAGTEVAINAGMRSNDSFSGWTVDGEGIFADASSVSTTFTMPASDATITAKWTSSRHRNNSSSTTAKPTEPVTGTSTTSATIDSNGNSKVILTEQNIADAIRSAQEEAKKKGVHAGEISAVIHVSTGKQDAETVTVNLPRTTQQEVIKNNISNVELVIDRPDLTIGMNLAAVMEINKQAKDDVQISATKIDSSKLGKAAIKAVGNRPVFQLKAIYNSGAKYVSDFGKGSVTVEIPYTLQRGEHAENIHAVYMDENRKVTYLTDSRYDNARKALVFSTSHFSVYGVGYKTDMERFSDIANHWAKEDIEFVADHELMSGTGNEKFSPDIAMTRGMFVTALGRLAKANVDDYKKSSFSDVAENVYYMPYIEWAAKHEIVKGIGNDRFAPDDLMTREQLAVLMERYANAIGFKLAEVYEEKIFADDIKISVWANDSVKLVQRAGIVSGKNNNIFDPQGIATRAEVSAVLKRFVELIQ